MALIQTRVLRDETVVNRRLAELDMDKVKLLTVRSRAISAAADAPPFHPANSAGTFSYHYGTFALRDAFVGDTWVVDRPDGVEAISNEGKKTKVVFANVDHAGGDDDHAPKPRSRKGAGSERVCQGNLFGDSPRYVPSPDGTAGGFAIYYLMVDENGAVELSCPVVKRKTFAAYVERIILSDGSDLEGEGKLALDDKDIADGFDPQVARK